MEPEDGTVLPWDSDRVTAVDDVIDLVSLDEATIPRVDGGETLVIDVDLDSTDDEGEDIDQITDFWGWAGASEAAGVDNRASNTGMDEVEEDDRMSYVRGADCVGWDVKGENCPICLEVPKDGDFVTVLSCPGRHFMHLKCHSKFHAHDLKHQQDTYPTDAAEAARRAEGSQRCPLCKGLSYCWVNLMAQGCGVRMEEEA